MRGLLLGLMGLAALAVVAGMASGAAAETYWAVGVPASSTAIGPPQATTNVAVLNHGTTPATVFMGKGQTTCQLQSLNVEVATPEAPMEFFHFDDQLQGSQISDTGVYCIDTPTATDFEVMQWGPAAVGTSSTEGTRLLPESELGTSYRAGTWKDAGNSFVCVATCVNYSQDMTFLTIIGIKQGTSVEVRVSCKNSASMVPGQVPAMTPGAPYTFTLGRGQALHIESPSTQNAPSLGGLLSCNLSGSTVESNTPVAVFAGNNCARMSDTTCDLIYTQILPDDKAGQVVVACSAFQHKLGGVDLLMVRSTDPTGMVTFEVPVGSAPAGPFTISSAAISNSAWAFFYYKADTVLYGTGPMHVMQIMAESTLPVPIAGIYIPGDPAGVNPRRGWGDPAQTQLSSIEEASYERWFTSPASFYDHIYIASRVDAVLELDGRALPTGLAIGTSPYTCTSVPLGPSDDPYQEESNIGASHRLMDQNGGPITAQVLGLGLSAALLYDVGTPPPIVPVPVPVQGSFKWTAKVDGCGPRPVRFTDTSTPGDSPIVSWTWDFGDGTTSNEQNPTHIYAREGIYNVVETVEDQDGFTSSTYQTIEATVGPPCIEPTGPQDNGMQPRPPRDGVDQGIAGDDIDFDRIANALDNCPYDGNPEQADMDDDGQGNACDADVDGDTVLNASDNCVEAPNVAQTDLDGDGQGDACDGDRDGDDVPNTADNCPTAANPSQTDTDGDGQGDACQTGIALQAGPSASREGAGTPSSLQAAGASSPLGSILIAAGIALAVIILVAVLVGRRAR